MYREEFSSPSSALSNPHTNQSRISTRWRVADAIVLLLLLALLIALSEGQTGESVPCDTAETDEGEGCWSEGIGRAPMEQHWIFRIVDGDESSDLAKFEDDGKARSIFDVIAKDSTTPHQNQPHLISPHGKVVAQIHSNVRPKEARC
jgi:hypothetical protein